jgi:hypothetical protein
MMLNKFSRYFSIILFITACKQPLESKYYWLRFRDRDYQKADTLQILHFSEIDNDDTTRVSYTTKYGNSTYIFIRDRDSSFISSSIRDKLLHPNDSVVFIRKQYDTSIILKTDTFRVSEYILDEGVQDGATIQYFCPNFGVFLIHGDYWPGMNLLQTNDTAKNLQIKKVAMLVAPHRYRKMAIKN